MYTNSKIIVSCMFNYERNKKDLIGCKKVARDENECKDYHKGCEYEKLVDK